MLGGLVFGPVCRAVLVTVTRSGRLEQQTSLSRGSEAGVREQGVGGVSPGAAPLGLWVHTFSLLCVLTGPF